MEGGNGARPAGGLCRALDSSSCSSLFHCSGSSLGKVTTLLPLWVSAKGCQVLIQASRYYRVNMSTCHNVKMSRRPWRAIFVGVLKYAIACLVPESAHQNVPYRTQHIYCTTFVTISSMPNEGNALVLVVRRVFVLERVSSLSGLVFFIKFVSPVTGYRVCSTAAYRLFKI